MNNDEYGQKCMKTFDITYFKEYNKAINRKPTQKGGELMNAWQLNCPRGKPGFPGKVMDGSVMGTNIPA